MRAILLPGWDHAPMFQHCHGWKGLANKITVTRYSESHIPRHSARPNRSTWQRWCSTVAATAAAPMPPAMSMRRKCFW